MMHQPVDPEDYVPPEMRGKGRRPASLREACKCPCGSRYAAVAKPRELSGLMWEADIMCGECGEWRTLVLHDSTAQRLDRVLDKGMEPIRRAARAQDEERFEREADAFARALELDLITADDFRSHP